MRQWIEQEGVGGFVGLFANGPVEDDVRSVLAPLHGFDPKDPEAVSMWNTAIQAVFFDKMIDAMDEFFVIVSVVTLLLGGIGVMNIMLVAVKERTREIGIRKAVGATSRSIQWQFFSEGLALTLFSGGIGFCHRRRALHAGQPGADAGAVHGHDRHVAGGGVRRSRCSRRLAWRRRRTRRAARRTCRRSRRCGMRCSGHRRLTSDH